MTPQALEQLWAQGRTVFHMRDKSSVRLCKLEQIVAAASSASNASVAADEKSLAALTSTGALGAKSSGS